VKVPNQKRIVTALLSGAILGVFCIIGVGTRVGFSGNMIYLVGMWYNRVIMGLIIGLSGEVIVLENNLKNNSIIRGASIGLIVTSAIFLSTSFKDIPSFLVGILYGIIIDWVSTSES
jgi:hypothetical protein